MLRSLIVDDSRRFREAARVVLQRQGMAVVGVACTINEALQRVEELHPDVVLLDIDLGGESGFELARRLHERGGRTAARVILISTQAEQDYAELIASSPAIGFLPKSELSAAAILRLLDTGGDAGRSESVSGSRGT
ncbi:MAG TPA: response regulator transcription factor [Pilimelia sp.]|nr:response regulator transcription factor [Pilimelia sp.]